MFLSASHTWADFWSHDINRKWSNLPD